jgi:hypothetical protein
MSSAVVVFIALCGLLVAGKFVRIKIPLLQRLYLPSSVIGCAIGLVAMSLAGDAIDPEIPDAMRRVPGFLINVVFATLFLGTPLPNFRRVVSLAFPSCRRRATVPLSPRTPSRRISAAESYQQRRLPLVFTRSPRSSRSFTHFADFANFA